MTYQYCNDNGFGSGGSSHTSELLCIDDSNDKIRLKFTPISIKNIIYSLFIKSDKNFKIYSWCQISNDNILIN